MKISSIAINNFKNYLGINTINLDNEINIVYGDNGFGKSTLFEAIEWCLTGEIEKYKNLGDKDFDENDLINYHVKSSETVCSVEITFGENILIRSFKILNKKKYGRTGVKIINRYTKKINANGKREVDDFMKSDYLKKRKGSVEKFSEMVKSAYILSQDQISDFIFKENSEERYKAISSIMGLQSSVNLITNLKKIKIEAEKQKFIIDKKILDLESQVAGIDKNRILINENEFIKYNKELLIESKEKLSKEQINELSKKNTVESEKVQEILEVIYKLLHEKIHNIKELNNEVVEETKKVNKLHNKKYEVNNKILDYKDSLSKLEAERNNSFELINSLNEINWLKNEISNSKLGFDKNIINNILNDNLKNQEKLYYTKDNFNIYKSVNENTLEIPNKIRIIEDKILFLKKEDLEISLKLKKLYDITLGTKEALLFEFSKALKTIKKYITKDNTKGYCPVCKSFIGSNIEEVINNQILDYDNMVNKIKDTAKIHELDKGEINNRLNNIKVQINKLESNKNEFIRKLDMSTEQLDNIKKNKLFDEKYFSDSLLNVTNEIDRIEKENKRIQHVLECCTKLTNLMNKNKHLLNISGKDKEKFKIEDIDDEILKIKFINEDLEKELQRVNSDILIYDKKINIHKNYIEIIKSRNYSDDFTEFSVLKEHLKNKNNEIMNIFEKLEVYKKHLFDLEFNLKIDLNISSLKADILKLNKKKTEIKVITDSINELVITTKTVFGDGIKEFLNKPKSDVKKFFRYLNPIPTMNDLYFDGEGEALVVNVKCDCEENLYRSVGKTLSSGQMNALAIAIFLAINKSQKIYDLDFVALDDPIQNMDDVNQFSICDVLGNLNKQLIFSTHDPDFVRLFIKKNEFRKKKIQIIDLKSRYLEKDKIKFIKFDI